VWLAELVVTELLFERSSEVDDPYIDRVASAALMHERLAQRGTAADVRNSRA
jgi:hypothetical protein